MDEKFNLFQKEVEKVKEGFEKKLSEQLNVDVELKW